MQSDTLAEKHSITAEFLKTGPQVLEDPDGFIYNIVESSAVGGRNYRDKPNEDKFHEYGFQCLMEEPYKYSSNQLIKSKELDTNNQEWDTDNLYYGNLLDNWSFEKWSGGTVDVAPDGWVFHSAGIQRGSEHVIGNYSSLITGDGATFVRGKISASAKIDENANYIVAAWVKIEGRTSGTLNIDLYGTGVDTSGIQINRNTDGWELISHVENITSVPDDLSLRVFVANTPNADYKCYIDGIVLIKESEYNETYHKSIEEYRLSGNYLGNWSFENWSSGITSPPDGWIVTNPSIERSDENKIGNYSAKIKGSGSGNQILYYNLDGDALDGKNVTFAAWVKTYDTDVSIVIRDNSIASSSYHTGSGEWELLSVSKIWDKGTTSNLVRLILDEHSSSEAYFDAAYLTISSNYSPDYIDEVVPYGLTTEGTIDVIPDVEVVAGAKGSGYSTDMAIVQQDYASELTIPESSSYSLIYTETFSAVEGKAWKPISTKFTLTNDLAIWVIRVDVRIYAAGINGGVELSVYTTAASGAWPLTFEYTIPTEYISDGNTNLEIRYYARSENPLGRIYNIESVARYIGSDVLQDVTIYNTADTTRKVHVCNEMLPGTTVAINKNGTGSYNYPEDFTTDTYKYVSYDYNNITYDDPNDRITLAAADGYLIYPIDVKYPITGIPTLKLDIHSGPVKIAIADNVAGVPGTYYDIDDLTSTNYSSETVTFLLDSLNNYRLKGETSFFLKIYTDGATALVLNSLELDTDLVTIDTLLPKIYHGVPNTFRADQNADSSLNATVTLSYRDGHWVI